MASSLAYLPSDMFVYDVGNDELTVHEDLKSTLGECLGCSSLYACMCVCGGGGGGMCYGASPPTPISYHLWLCPEGHNRPSTG